LTGNQVKKQREKKATSATNNQFWVKNKGGQEFTA